MPKAKAKSKGIPKRVGVMPLFLEDNAEQDVFIAINRRNKRVVGARAFLVKDGGYNALVLPCTPTDHGVFVRILPTPRTIDYYMLLVVLYLEDGTKARFSFDLYNQAVPITSAVWPTVRFRVARGKTAEAEPK